MGIAIVAYTLSGNDSADTYECLDEGHALRLGIVAGQAYPANKCSVHLSISYQSYIELREFLGYLENKIGTHFVTSHFYETDGVISHRECEVISELLLSSIEKIQAITWADYTFDRFSSYDDKIDFLENLSHESRRSYQSDFALLKRHLRAFITMLKYTQERHGFIDFG
ncbi:hypothetical protein ITG10_03490 [Vibrio sp. ED004]|uniref:hypothetical protein n=1 Tax=unclassified Vibrio TaxID=2614977 RepID=UPI0003682CE2|nr:MULTISPECIES: hypothetical protein [unclassified Vibrio]UPR57417.1 hypothetical protein ITG10_03490 [Vibrio sp. ED004]